MLLTLTQSPTRNESDLFNSLLNSTDQVLLTGAALVLAFDKNPFPARGVIRQQEAIKFGGQPHADWQLLSDQEWTNLALHSEQNVEW
jgi:hypothetical protein